LRLRAQLGTSSPSGGGGCDGVAGAAGAGGILPRDCGETRGGRRCCLRQQQSVLDSVPSGCTARAGNRPFFAGKRPARPYNKAPYKMDFRRRPPTARNRPGAARTVDVAGVEEPRPPRVDVAAVLEGVLDAVDGHVALRRSDALINYGKRLPSNRLQ
jgi:hypothetical protein